MYVTLGNFFATWCKAIVSKQQPFLKIVKWNFFLFDLQNYERMPKWNMPIDIIICDQMLGTPEKSYFGTNNDVFVAWQPMPIAETMGVHEHCSFACLCTLWLFIQWYMLEMNCPTSCRHSWQVKKPHSYSTTTYQTFLCKNTVSKHHLGCK